MMECYKEEAQRIGLRYPVVVKILEASRNPNSHNFYVASNEKGFEEALNYKGFQGNDLVIQELI